MLKFGWILYVFLLCGVNASGEAKNSAPAARKFVGIREIEILDESENEGVSFSRDGSTILTFGKTAVEVWDAKTYAAIGNPLIHGEGLWSAQFDAAADKVLTIGCTRRNLKVAAGDAKVWDIRTGKLLLPPIRHGEGPASDAALSPDGKLVATCSEKDRTVRVWEVATGKERRKLDHEKDVWAVQFDPTGSILVTTGPVNTLWDTRTWTVRTSLSGTPLYTPVPAFSQDGKRIAVATDKTFEVYELATAKKLCDNEPYFLHLDSFMAAIAMSADGTRVATVSTDGGVVWDATTGKPLLGEPKQGEVLGQKIHGFDHAPVLNGDGSLVIFNEAEPRIWEVTSRRHIKLNDKFVPAAACFSPDGKTLAICNYNHSTSIILIRTSDKEGQKDDAAPR